MTSDDAVLAALIARGVVIETPNTAAAPRAPGAPDFLYTTRSPAAAPSGIVWTEIDSDEKTSDTSITHTTEATADLLLSVGGDVPPGAIQRIQFYAPAWRAGTANIALILAIYDDLAGPAASMGIAGRTFSPTSGQDDGPVHADFRPSSVTFGPFAGTVAWSIRAFVSSSTATVRGNSGGSGGGGAGLNVPMNARLLVGVPWPAA